MILVTGATGTVGRALIEQLLAAGEQVRAVTRRPESARLPAAVEVVRAELGDAAAVSAAMRDVDRVFLLSTGPAIPEHDATVAGAAAAAGVTRLVKLSSGRAGDATATDPIPTWHRAGEAAVWASGVASTVIRPLGFMSNALHWAGTVRVHGAVHAPYGQGRIAVIDPRDIAAVAVAALTTDAHLGQIYTLSGPQALSPGEQTAIIGEVLGRKLEFREIAPEQARQALLDHGVPTELADAIMALRATALASFTSVVHDSVERITGVPPRTFRQWATDHAAEFRLGAA
ncbi:NAD(P)H-binding protein [Nocardia vulneris]|uniref:Nucleoside-diphosphate sugar epimerase n=1 Tax=Nocardia vulneris TaxID=1141657 RepID=A0ABR4ZJV7_9NOCA|nr:NAD(P)H-binding protein [Nocardia vulneris]KIA65703.1 nucleoside-diphosphate sugar epimerase [Nocardia vulneris]